MATPHFLPLQSLLWVLWRLYAYDYKWLFMAFHNKVCICVRDTWQCEPDKHHTSSYRADAVDIDVSHIREQSWPDHTSTLSAILVIVSWNVIYRHNWNLISGDTRTGSTLEKTQKHITHFIPNNTLVLSSPLTRPIIKLPDLCHPPLFFDIPDFFETM